MLLIRAGLPLAALLPLAMVATLTSCGLFGGDPKPEDTARSFVQALAGTDTAAAGELTDRPADAAALLKKVRDALEPTAMRAELDQIRDSGTGTAAASFTFTWTLGE